MNDQDNIIAEGEATGHAHRVKGNNFRLEGTIGSRTIIAEDSVEITHEEHDNFTIKAGEYETGTVIEQDHFADEAREVLD